MPELKPLWEVQVLDVQRRALEIKLKEGQMSGDLRDLKNEIEKDRAVFNKLKEKYKGLKKDLRAKELDATSATEQARTLGQKLYGGMITNIKEINTSNKKLDSLKSMVDRTEDEILILMEDAGEIKAKLEEMSSRLNSKAENYRRMHGTYLANQQNVRQQLAQIPLQRQKLLDKLDVDLWNKYLEMKKRYNDPLARVEKGNCMGCRMGIPFNDMRLLKQGEGLVYCSNCGRILFWER
ncbi:MAG: putative zinc ribbon domain protein [Firmicutes bacterium ADurb.Bin456]|nr:MAG: putative zinc ribbon domain protein [Firmicutes bacterium ADurb.Bin456]